MSMGFDGFISKPIQTPSLHSALLKFVKDKQPPEIIEAALIANANKPAPKIDINNFQRNPELLAELKKLFVKNHINTMSTIRQSLENDAETAHRLAHTIKSSAAMIFEDTLSEAAKDIELVLAKKEQPTAEQLSALEAELERVLSIIAEPQAITAVDSPLNPQEALALLDKVEPLLKNRNSTCMELLPDLRRIPDSDLLCTQMENYNFSDALKTLEALRGKV
jgi:HPt (histidine-containing phosphotransfer) domain-containing protein